MRKYLLLIMVIGFALSASAVTRTELRRKPTLRRTEVVETRPHLGWFLAPVLKLGKIKDDTKALIGLRGGLELNRSLYVGVAGYGLPEEDFDDHTRRHHRDHDDDWVLGYGGLELGVIAGRPKSGQLSFGVLFGGGGISEDSRYFRDYNGFFVMEPQLDLLVNLSSNVRVTVGASYRFVDDLQSLHYTEDDLQGPSVNIGVALGCF
jgi:hypothetical protein